MSSETVPSSVTVSSSERVASTETVPSSEYFSSSETVTLSETVFDDEEKEALKFAVPEDKSHVHIGTKEAADEIVEDELFRASPEEPTQADYDPVAGVSRMKDNSPGSKVLTAVRDNPIISITAASASHKPLSLSLSIAAVLTRYVG